MSAHVATFHVALCFDCGWEGEERAFRDNAEGDANGHECESADRTSGGAS